MVGTATVGVIMLVAMLAEALTEVIKNLFPEGVIKDKASYAVSVVVGIVLAFAFGVDLFGLTGFGHYVSIVATGLLASRGANYVNGFLKQIGVLKSA